MFRVLGKLPDPRGQISSVIVVLSLLSLIPLFNLDCCSDMCSQLSLLLSQLHVLQGQMVHYTIHITFSVPHITEASNDGQIYSSLMPLEVNSISLATGYKFKHENQSIYLSKDLCEFTPRRQWPNITLPIPASIPHQPAPVGPNTQLIRAMQATHDMAADILQSQGTDPCAVYREKWSTSLTMWKVAIKSVRCAIRSCLLPRS